MMIRINYIAIVQVLMIGAMGTLAIADDSSPSDALTNQIIVRLHSDGTIGHINNQHKTTTIASLPEQQLFLIELPQQADPNAILQLLSVDENVEWVEFNVGLGISDGHTQSFFVSATEADFLDQYLFDVLEKDDSHELAAGQGVVVAVLDTGIDASHEMLEGRVLDEGYNFIDMNEETGEVSNGGALAGHGTFMAGVIASLAPDTQLLPITVLSSEGQGDLFHIVAGIDFAVNAGVDVINISVGSEYDANALDLAMEIADEAGVLVVASAGNGDTASPMLYPAADPRAMAIASTDEYDEKSAFSNYGQHIDLCAPGSQVISTLPGNLYAVADGTSISAAAVSAAAALMRSTDPQLTASEIIDILKDGALNIDQSNILYEGLLGSGRIRLNESLCLAMDTDADLNNDGIVNVRDLSLLLSAWGSASSPSHDVNCNGSVGIADLLIMMSQWEQ